MTGYLFNVITACSVSRIAEEFSPSCRDLGVSERLRRSHSNSRVGEPKGGRVAWVGAGSWQSCGGWSGSLELCHIPCRKGQKSPWPGLVCGGGRGQRCQAELVKKEPSHSAGTIPFGALIGSGQGESEVIVG